jgi:hypothetical protein
MKTIDRDDMFLFAVRRLFSMALGIAALTTFSTNTLAVNWAPDDMTNFASLVVSWYDAADTTTLWADTGASTPATTSIARWDDKGGAVNNYLLQDSGTPQTGGVLNGRNTVQCTAVRMAPTLDFDFLAAFCVYYDLDGTQFVWGDNNNGEYTAIFAGTDTDPDVSLDGGTSAKGQISVNGSELSTLSANPGLGLNSTQKQGTNEWYFAWENRVQDIYFLPGSDAGGTKLFSGKIGEMIFLSTQPDEPTRQLFEGYLTWKWGLQSSLPSDHPYKDGAPTITPAGSVFIVR